MGSDIHLVVVGGRRGLVDDAKRRVDELERRWSRFLVDSEVSELNRRAGAAVPVSPDTVLLVERAVEAWRLSAGWFDPTVLGAVIRAGYGRSFEELGPTPPAGHSLLTTGAASIEAVGDTVRVPSGTGFDPGGLGKGLAADLVALELMRAGAEGACINIGGDVRVTGVGPNGSPWTVAVEHPWSEEPIARLGLTDGAVTTSTTLKRRWRSDGAAQHHLIDPHTGLPSETDLDLATVVSDQAWVAEVLAKVVLLRGLPYPFDIVDGTGAEALVVDHAGRIDSTRGFAGYLGGLALPEAISVNCAGVGYGDE
jgi:FAD:protein FMN transferase